MLFSTRSKPLIGLDITTSSIKLIELSGSVRNCRAECYAAEPTPQNAINEKAIVDAEAVGEAVGVGEFAEPARGFFHVLERKAEGAVVHGDQPPGMQFAEDFNCFIRSHVQVAKRFGMVSADRQQRNLGPDVRRRASLVIHSGTR